MISAGLHIWGGFHSYEDTQKPEVYRYLNPDNDLW